MTAPLYDGIDQAHENGYVSARGGKWHRATVAEPTFMHAEATACGQQFTPLNVTWHGDKPPTTTAYMCQRPGCARKE